jgi:hypothetical protein
MRASLATLAIATSWLTGLPYVALGLAVWPKLGLPACLAGLAHGSLAMFVVFLPVAAMATRGGAAVPADAPAPELSVKAHAVLMLLWTVMVWGSALLVAGG